MEHNMITVKVEPDNYDGTTHARVEWHGQVYLGPEDEQGKPDFKAWFKAYCLETFGEYKEQEG